MSVSIAQSFLLDWLGSVAGSRILFELDPGQEPNSLCPANRKYPWELPVVPVGDTGTIPLRSRFPCDGAYGDHTKGGGDGCPLRYVNLTRGLWDGPVTCNGGRCDMKPCFQIFCFIYADHYN